MVREAVVSGTFYDSDTQILKEQIESSFKSKFGAGALPAKRTNEKIKGVIVPHAGYSFSAACASWAYKEIAESNISGTFLLLGPNHFGYGSGISIEDWRTPLGLIKTDKDIIRGIKENTNLSINESCHEREHSIEVQLPMLQHTNLDMIEKIRIIPIAVSNDIDYVKLASDLKNYLDSINKKITIIVSSDFTHYGKNYNYLPFTTDVPKRITELDKGAIDLILDKDSDGFKKYINKTFITICGYMPILVFLEMIKDENEKGHLLMHYTSGDILSDYKNSVSYASIVFK